MISCGRKYILGGEAAQKHWVPGNTPGNTSAPNLCSHSRQRATREDTWTSLESITAFTPGKGYKEIQALQDSMHVGYGEEYPMHISIKTAALIWHLVLENYV